MWEEGGKVERDLGRDGGELGWAGMRGIHLSK